jgi:hypothetical protein
MDFAVASVAERDEIARPFAADLEIRSMMELQRPIIATAGPAPSFAVPLPHSLPVIGSQVSLVALQRLARSLTFFVGCSPKMNSTSITSPSCSVCQCSSIQA